MNTIFKYVTKDGRELGYHLSTFCQVGPKEKAKQYLCEGPEQVESQRQTILNNFKHVMNEENVTSIFASVHADTRSTYFPGLKFDDVDLVAEETDLPEESRKYVVITPNQGE